VAKKRRQSGAVTGSGSAAQSRASAERAAQSMDLWDRIAWTCLHALVVLVPIAMSNWGPFSADGVPFTFDQFDIMKVFVQRGLVLVALGAWGIGLLLRGGKVRFTRVEWAVLAFIAWVVLTSVLSVHPPTAIFGKYRRFEGLVSFVTYAAAFFVALQYADRQTRIRSLARTLAIGGFLVAAYGALQVVGSASLGVARILQPVSLILALAIAAACLAVAFSHIGLDREVRLALLLGAGFAFVGGVILYAGLGDNIAFAVGRGLDVVTLDPVRWGQLPFETNRAFSTFGNPDLLGGYLIFPWAVTLGLALSERSRTWRGIYWAFTVLNAFVGITSYVRGAWIGATVSLILFVIAYRRARAGSDMRLQTLDWGFIGTAGAVAVAAIAASSVRPDAVRNVLARVVSIFEFDQGSALTRFQIWEAALAAVAERPIFGWGADTFRLLFPMFKPAEYVQAAGYLSVADNVHNYPLQLATGIGIPGALLLYGLIAWALVSSVGEVFARGKGPERLVLAGFWAAVAGYVVHLLFGLSVTGSTIFLWLSIGILLSPGAHTRTLAAPSWRTPAAAAILALVLLGTVLNVRFIVADNHYLQGRVLNRGVTSVPEIERAIELNPYNDMYRLELGSAWQAAFQQEAEAYASSGDQAQLLQAMQYLERAEQAYRDMIDYVPEEYDTYVFFTNLYNQAAAYIDPAYAEKAIEIGKRGIEVEEYGPAVRVQVAVAYSSQGQFEEALAELEVATALDSRYVQAWLLMAETYRQMERPEDARAAYEHVLTRSPDNADALAGIAALDAEETTVP